MKIVAGFALLIAAWAYRAACVCALWNWYISPVLCTKPINLATAVGITTVVHLWISTSVPIRKEKEEKEKEEFSPIFDRVIYGFFSSVSTSTFSLIMGYIVHRWM